MAVIAAFSIDLSQIEACRISAVSQISVTFRCLAKMPIGENPKAIASNAFASCYAQVWQKVSDDADAVITAASEYDTLATVGSDPEDQLGDAVKRLGTNIDALSRTWTQVDVSKLFDDVMLIALMPNRSSKHCHPARPEASKLAAQSAIVRNNLRPSRSYYNRTTMSATAGLR